MLWFSIFLAAFFWRVGALFAGYARGKLPGRAYCSPWRFRSAQRHATIYPRGEEGRFSCGDGLLVALHEKRRENPCVCRKPAGSRLVTG